MLKKHYKLLLKCALALPIIFLVDFCGLLTHLYELDFETHYYYPLHNNKSDRAAASSASQLNYQFLQMPAYTGERDAANSPRLTIIVKSALGNLQRRQAIRKTWGYEARFSDVRIRRAFVLGVPEGHESKDTAEAKHHGDILRANFVDAYFNNTIKTMMGLRWASEHFNSSDFYLFVDDDYYVSVKNVLRFMSRNRQPELFAGYVFQSAPLRHKFSKWYISLDEYPFDKFPPYVTAGAFLLSRDALLRMYAVASNLPLFRFDDVYLGMVALQAHIAVNRCDDFHFYRPDYKGPDSYSDVIASHGFSDPVEMERVWNECRSANYA